MSKLLLRARPEPGPDGLLLGLTAAEAGWHYIDFQAYRLRPGQVVRGGTGAREVALIVLGGRCSFQAGLQAYPHVGERADVWERRPPYTLLLPPGTEYAAVAESAVHLAVCGAPAGGSGGPPRLITPAAVVREERGAGQTARVVQHILPPTAPAARLILVEVYTPAGHWSSFPPHKHDTENPPAESYLEEIYYYQVQPRTGFAVQRVYSADRALDETMAPGDGDLVLVPRGYHPVAATPGHECYYLNVMAGPTRAWNFQVDPDYAHLMNWQKPEVAKTGEP